jgi:hypothetical protein
MKEVSYNKPNCYYFFPISKTSALFVKIFALCFLFSLLNTKTLTNNPNTKVYSLKHNQFSHLCHIKTLF